jgi:hypothetical protein
MAKTLAMRIGMLWTMVLGLHAQYALAQAGYPADPLFEATYYLQIAREKRTTCLVEAERWAKKASAVLKSYRGVSEAERAAAGLLKGKAEFALSEIRNQYSTERYHLHQAEQYLNSKNLHPTGGELNRATGLSCEVTYQDLMRTWTSRSSEVEQLIARGNAALILDPRRAEGFYRQAQKLDVRNSYIKDSIDNAKRVRRREGGSGWAKGVFYTVAIAAVIGGGYYHAQQQRKRDASQLRYVR